MMLMRRMKVTVEADDDFFNNLSYGEQTKGLLDAKVPIQQVRQQQVTSTTAAPPQDINITNLFDPRNIARVLTTPQLKHQEHISSPNYLSDKRKLLMKSLAESQKLYKEMYQGTQNSIGDHIIYNPERERMIQNAQKARLYEDTKCLDIVTHLRDCLNTNTNNNNTTKNINNKNSSTSGKDKQSSRNCEEEQISYHNCMS